jgi:hypothetical protein
MRRAGLGVSPLQVTLPIAPSAPWLGESTIENVSASPSHPSR